MFYERNTAVRLRACGSVLWVGSVASDVQQQPANGGYDYYLVDLKNRVQVENEMKFDLLKQKPPLKPVTLDSGVVVDHRRDERGKLHAVVRTSGFREMTPQEVGEYSVLIDAIVWA
jgi:hypothetical protein